MRIRRHAKTPGMTKILSYGVANTFLNICTGTGSSDENFHEVPEIHVSLTVSKIFIYLFTYFYLSYGPVIRASFYFDLSRNIVASLVEPHCCAHYYVCDQNCLAAAKYSVASWGNMLRKVDSSSTVCSKFFAPRITTESTTCLATHLYSTLVIGCR